MKMHLKYFAIFALFIIMNGCLEDNSKTVEPVTIDNTALLLKYFEEGNNFVNTSQMPPIMDAEELFNNLDNYLILDIRGQSDYQNGHIKNAVNVASSELANIAGISTKLKIVIVSYTGQSACYYATLLRYLDLNNVYALKYGMCSWNKVFIGPWSKMITNQFNIGLTNEFNTKNSFKPMPAVDLAPGQSIQSWVEERIKNLLSMSFEDTLTTNYNSGLTTDFEHLPGTDSLYCFGPDYSFISPIDGVFHPVRSRYLSDSPNSDLQAARQLQTLPPASPVSIYSFNGQRSACAVAYLRILGYNARSVLFGFSSFGYLTLAHNNGFDNETLTIDDIKNYDYVK